jgi:branched-chain amino acid transport system ATP-binding protein
MPDAKPVLLQVTNLTVNYGVITALHGLSLEVRQGDIVTLIGANGAGKTTTLRAISGLLRARSGKILYNRLDITPLPPHQIVQRGLCHVPEGRMIFANLTVMENLWMGAYLQKDRRPKFLMLDEPSLGIAPLLVKTIFEKIVEINRSHGITILLVEQNANLALEVASFGYVLETGRITLNDRSAALRENAAVRKAYLGVA